MLCLVLHDGECVAGPSDGRLQHVLGHVVALQRRTLHKAIPAETHSAQLRTYCHAYVIIGGVYVALFCLTDQVHAT
jgi:hypothetical protein